MPSDMVSLAISTGVGFSLLAGIVSGVCFVVVHGINRQKRTRRNSLQWRCSVCDASLRSYEGVLEGERVVSCQRCEGRVCRVRCSRRDPHTGTWTCETCHRQPAWYRNILHLIQPPFKVAIPRAKMNSDRPEKLEEDLEAIRKKQRDEVRDFIEKIVTSMLGGDVDDVTVTKLYNDKNYLPVTGENPCTAHAALKKLIQRLLQEALDLPSLKRSEENPAAPANESNRTYEDLLATAILNKVITNCQQNLPTSSANSVSSRLSTSSRNKDDGKEYFFGEETLDSKWKTTDLDSTSVSSLEEWIQSDSSLGSTKYVDRVSLTIQHRIEEVTPTDSEDEEREPEDAEYFRKTTTLDEDSNWFLQRRQFRGGTRSPVPVPMLVPDPAPEAKVLIGDREAGETSDLSDVGSDYGDTERCADIGSVLVDSRTVIGGRNPLQKQAANGCRHSDEDELSADSGVKVESGLCNGSRECLLPPRADKTVDDDNVEDASILSTYSNTEKDTEYTERYASLPRTIMKSPPSASLERCVKEPLIPGLDEETENIQNGTDEKNGADPSYENVEFTGAYSKKEKEKWKHAVDMKNNPYSKENIEKRLKSRSSVSSIFGSDYYARLASNPSGGKIRESSDDQEVGTLSCDLNLSEIGPSETLKADKVSEETYSAVPARVVEDEGPSENGKIEPVYREEQKLAITETSDVDTTLSELTSDSDMSYVHCYDVETAQVFKKPPEEISKPDGLFYRQKEDTDIILDIITRQLIDENHNTKYVDEDEYEISILNRDVKNKQKEVEKTKKSESKVSIVEMKLKNGRSAEILVPQSDSRKHKTYKENLDGSVDNTVSSTVIVDEDTVDASNVNVVNVSKPGEQIISNKMSMSEQNSPRYQKFCVTKEIQLSHRSNVAKKIDVSSAQNRIRKFSEGELNEGSSSPIIMNKKSDNTLIKKIYSDPLVRTFAMQSRENLPVLFSEEKAVQGEVGTGDERCIYTSSPEPAGKSIHERPVFTRHLQRSMSQFLVRDDQSYLANRIKRSASLAPTDDSDTASDYQAFSLGSYTSDRTEASKASSHAVADAEIVELQGKKLVKSRLGEISKSFPNVSKISGVRLTKHASAGQSASFSSETLNGSHKSDEVPISVKDLKKKFEHADDTSRKDRLIYSLTARSLSKQVREDLKNQNLDEPLSIEVVKCETPTPTPEPMAEVIEEPILDTESKIKFYEKLNE